MLNRKYTITLNEARTEELRKHLKKQGISLSGYIRTVINENLQMLSMLNPKDKKPKVTAQTLLEMAAKMAKELENE